MKKFIGLCILVILLVAATGCTQQAKPAAETPVPTTVVATAVPTTVATTVPPTTIVTTVVPTTAAPAANVTSVATTVAATATTPKAAATPSTKVTIIHIQNNTFVPNSLTVLPGTGITWINDDLTIHAIKTVTGTPFMFSSGDIVSGATYGYTFPSTPGSYGFIDTYTNATGTIIIQNGDSVVGAPTLQSLAPTATPA